MKGWIIALVLCMVISLTDTLKVGVADLSDDATKAKYDALSAAGIFDGVGETQFWLKEEMNRAQFAKVTALIFGLEPVPHTSSFTDVSSDDFGYALPYIEAIKAAGITNGVGEGRFDPTGAVTKEQLATFIVRGLGKPIDDQRPVDDPTVSDWAKEYVAAALQLKLMSNGTDGTFGGTANATGDLLVMASYEAAKQADKIDLPPLPSPPVTPPVEQPPATQEQGTQEPGDSE